MRAHIVAALLVIGLSHAAPAYAHSKTQSVTPASGSILPSSPEEIVVTFNETARMTSAVVVSDGARDRKLEITPSGSAQSFTIQSPELGEGRNEIEWKALSKDGHVVSGSIIIVIDPGAEAVTAGEASGDHEHNGH